MATSGKKVSDSEPTKAAPTSFKRKFYMFLGLYFAFRMVQNYRTATEDPYMFILPNMMLFMGSPMTPVVKYLWTRMAHWDKSKGKREHQPVPEIDASEYSYEKLREITNDFLEPAIVRGLFDGVPAQTLWPQPGYLVNKDPLGDMEVPVVGNATYQTWEYEKRDPIKFRQAFGELLENEDSKHYLFFPMELGGAKDALRETTDKVIKDDLEIHRIFPGFGSDIPGIHKVFEGGQIIAGRGKPNKEETTGSDWHCAPGNNWFVQIVGRKRWYFMNPKYSAYLHPVVNTWLSLKTTLKPDEVAEVQQYVPMKYADISAGDLLYNPDWQWHTVINYGGLAIGCPLREFIIKKAFENNFQYTSIAVVNNIVMRIYQAFGGTILKMEN